jgi:hypothetical protein
VASGRTIISVDDRTSSLIIAGNGKTGTSQSMIARMREDLDRQLAGHAR